MDEFIIYSDDNFFTRNNFTSAQIEDSNLHDFLNMENGTVVRMTLNNNSKKVLSEVFDTFAPVNEGFIKTTIPVAHMFSGGNPVCVSDKADFKNIQSAVGGTDGKAYYVCIDKVVYVYYPNENLWYMEDELDVISFASSNGVLYALTSEGEIIRFKSGEEKVKWYFTTPEYNFYCPETKNIRRLYIRADVPKGCFCKM
jgi:hypothetical protein